MKLLTQELLSKLPDLYSVENNPDPLVQVKFVQPDGSWTWYVIEFDGEDTFFGIVDGFEREMGYFSLSELQTHHGSLGLPIERDLFFEPCPISQLPKR